MRKRVLTALSACLIVASLNVALDAGRAGAANLPPSEWVIGPQSRAVILTFDGQAKGEALARVLGDLADKDARATFFLPGSYVDKHPDKARLILAANNKLGNAGWGKERFTTMSDAQIRESIRRSQEALQKINVYPRPYLRVPNGARNVRVLNTAGSLGYRSVRWTYHPHAGKVKEIAGRVVRTAQAGSVISLDLWRASHRAAVPRILDGLERKGFGFKTVESLEKTHPIRWDVTLRAGSEGPEVRYLQKTLQSISYPVGHTGGSFGYSTLQSVYAFEKVNRITRDGVVTPQQMTDIAVAQRPRTPKRGPKNFVDVDVSRQVLFEVKKDRVVHTIPVSSGNEATYTTDDGEEKTAHTPRGNFSVVRKIA
ncbi:MAG TPA: polysaccharide deacetylase family protein, partial [Actinomycetota bacterium]|nr:polysaccharide deacetylase family protein [Actinomycetota bacterium]